MYHRYRQFLALCKHKLPRTCNKVVTLCAINIASQKVDVPNCVHSNTNKQIKANWTNVGAVPADNRRDLLLSKLLERHARESVRGSHHFQFV